MKFVVVLICIAARKCLYTLAISKLLTIRYINISKASVFSVIPDFVINPRFIA